MIKEKCLKIINDNLKSIEQLLNVSIKIIIVDEVLKEHYHLGTPERLEGVINDGDKIIVIYPKNIYINRCGLYPEPFNWQSFEEHVIRVLAHEMFHLWQIENGKYYDDNVEFEADKFSLQVVNNRNK